MVLSRRLSITVYPFHWFDDKNKRCLLFYATKVIFLLDCKPPVHVDKMARILHQGCALENAERDK